MTRRAFIEAKYVQKAFLRALPAASAIPSFPCSVNNLSSIKHTRVNSHDDDDDDDEESPVPNSVTTTRFVLYFSSDVFCVYFTLMKSYRADASSEPETKQKDEPLSIWNVNTYLYEGARQRNLIMMLHALALGADKNFINENDHGKTPLIQAILSVC